MCVCVRVSHVGAGIFGRQKRMQGPLGLELQVVCDLPDVMLRTKLRPSGRAASSLSH